MMEDLLDLYNFKSTLWNFKLAELKSNKSRDWTEKDLDTVLKSLKKNKARDPHGLVNEIFYLVL